MLKYVPLSLPYVTSSGVYSHNNIGLDKQFTIHLSSLLFTAVSEGMYCCCDSKQYDW